MISIVSVCLLLAIFLSVLPSFLPLTCVAIIVYRCGPAQPNPRQRDAKASHSVSLTYLSLTHSLGTALSFFLESTYTTHICAQTCTLKQIRLYHTPTLAAPALFFFFLELVRIWKTVPRGAREKVAPARILIYVYKPAHTSIHDMCV